MKRLLPLAFLAATFSSAFAETPAEFDSRMEWFREARFGMFIHWGVYSVPAGEWDGKKYGGGVEWIQSKAQIPADDYLKLKDQFNPVRYDADAWVRLAKEAGMTYIVITSKHHDGFCLWDSAQTDWDIASTPYKKDLLKPLAEACEKHGLTLCFYHSIMDWHHPDYGNKAPWRGNAKNEAPDMDAYTTYMKAQLKELTTNYGKVGIMWFDGEWESSWTHAAGIDLYDYVRSLQPGIIVNNRVDKGRRGMEGLSKGDEFRGDYGTPEQQIPARGIPGLDWESCMTMNGTWGFSAHDHNWKSTTTLIHNLIDIASKGGNYLLNVGPTAEGEIPAPSVERLKAMGQWMKTNGESIYGTQANPFSQTPWGRCTTKTIEGGNTRIYLQVFNWPTDGVLTIPGLSNKVSKAYLLADRDQAIEHKRDQDSLTLTLPKTAPDPVASVIAVEIQGAPKIEKLSFRPNKKGLLTLTANNATLEGSTFKVETKRQEPNVGFWSKKADILSFPIVIAKAGPHAITLRASCDPKEGGGRAEIRLLDSDNKPVTKLPFDVLKTRNWDDFQDHANGKIEILEPGSYTLQIVPLKIPGAGLMNFSRLTLQAKD